MSKAYRVVIVEDEWLARQRLVKLLGPHKQLIDIVGEASNGEEGLEMIELLKPDFIFLDIQMPDINGFTVYDQLQKKPSVIFTTAYDT